MVTGLALAFNLFFLPGVTPAETPTCIYVETPPAEQRWAWVRQTKTPAFKLESEIKKECHVVVDPNAWPVYTF